MYRTRSILAVPVLAGLFLISPALAQHEPHPPAGPDHHGEAAARPHAADHVGDPYPFDACPVTGKTLGSMGDPVVKLYDNREVRFCCPGCPPKFEKDLTASVAKIDEKIVKDQGPIYPLKTSVVTGKDLPPRPFQFVYRNRMVRLGAEGEKADFLKDPKKHLAALDKAVVEGQGKDYPLATCPVSKDKLGGDMGKPVDLVVAGRLVRLCCKGCTEDVEKDPAKFVALVESARKAADGKAGAKPSDAPKHGG
jgi:hypothetical protein